MKKIDFKNFRAYTDITHEVTTTEDIRKGFADMIYRNVNGIVAHDLALRIYRAEDPIELTEEEEQIILRMAEQALPIFMDSMKLNLYGEAD